MSILDNIKNERDEDTQRKILEETKRQFLGSVSQQEIEKLNSRHEGHSEWNNKKKLANKNNGKIGDFDFSYIFKLHEKAKNPKSGESQAGPPTGLPRPPPPPPPAPAQAARQERKLKKLHWNVLPSNLTKGDTIWSSSAKVDWDQVNCQELMKIKIL